MAGKKSGAPPKKGPNSQGIDAPVKSILEPETLEMIDSFQNDRTIGLPEEAYEQEDQTIREDSSHQGSVDPEGRHWSPCSTPQPPQPPSQS